MISFLKEELSRNLLTKLYKCIFTNLLGSNSYTFTINSANIDSSSSWTPGSIIYSPTRYTTISFGYDEVHVLFKLDTDAGSTFSNFAVYLATNSTSGSVRYYNFIS